MPEPKIVPYTEDELYIVPPKKGAPQPAKVVSMDAGGKVLESLPAVNPFTPKVNKSFVEENRTLLIISGILLVSIGLYIYYLRRQRREDVLKRKGGH